MSGKNRALTPIFLSLASGAAAVFGFAPFEVFPVLLVALAVLTHLWVRAERARDAFLTGYLFGLGFFLAGVSWIYVSLHRYGGLPAPLAAFATFLFCALLALFPALAGWLQAKVRAAPAARALLVIPGLWTLAEWVRSWFLTGFPWLSAGYAAIDWPLAGFAPLGGVFLVSLAVVSCAGLLWLMATRRSFLAAAALFASVGAGGALLGSIRWTDPEGGPVSVALLQGNIPQDLKFDPARYARTLDTYARLADGSSARLIVLPETAVPRFLDRVDPAYLDRLERVARRNAGDLLLGVPVQAAPAQYFNSVVSLGVSPRQAYHKVHLVPLGEFVPPGFGWIVRALQIPLSDFSRGAQSQRPLAVAGQRVAVNVCYEDAFGAEIARQLPEATLLVNVSNVAWFGDSLAPAQHLQIARMRALETGRMLLAATNSGVTAAIDRDARVIARLPPFTEGRLEAEARGYSGATPYVRLGDWLAVGLAALAVLAFAIRSRSR
jgi:apolipoprotein N-acyltransferase